MPEVPRDEIAQPSESVPALTEALKDEDLGVRLAFTEALGRCGPAAVPALIEALKDKDSTVRWIAAVSLGNIGPAAKVAVPALTERMNDEDDDFRSAVEAALKQIQDGNFSGR